MVRVFHLDRVTDVDVTVGNLHPLHPRDRLCRSRVHVVVVLWLGRRHERSDDTGVNGQELVVGLLSCWIVY